MGGLLALPIALALIVWPRRSRLKSVRMIWPALWFLLALPCAWLFHQRYWIWRDCFNEWGRCFDPDEGVMLEQAGLVWGSLALVFGCCFGIAVFRALRPVGFPKRQRLG